MWYRSQAQAQGPNFKELLILALRQKQITLHGPNFSWKEDENFGSWITFFLGWGQRVRANGGVSDWWPVTSGGSTGLHPPLVLFNTFTNDSDDWDWKEYWVRLLMTLKWEELSTPSGQIRDGPPSTVWS